MGKSFQRTLVTAALPYANGPIHLGHVAGAHLPPDIYCRWLRLCGEDVAFICGSDEHGVPITLAARKEGVEPQVIVDRYHAMIVDAFERLGVSFDWYGRTSSQTHHETSSEFFRHLAAKDAFTLRTEQQLWDPEAETFLADRYVRGTCPKCGHEEAYGDQCETCGTALSPSELVNPRSVITSATPQLRDTTHWYLPLGRQQQELEQWIGGHGDWKPNVLGQIKSWFVDGLGDRAMTRDLPWGVRVPEDVAEAAGVDAAGKVLYVWFDAPIGYISATREWADSKGEPELWRRYWQDDGTRLIHFIGKDNIVFHCIIFPAMLQRHGDYILPDNVPANEFLNLEGNKLSTSRGWAVWLHEALDAFPADYLRYSLCATLPETRDSDFSWKDFQGHINNELADTLGNLVNRTLTFAHRYCDGRVPELTEPSDLDRATLATIGDRPAVVGECIDTFRFRDALHEAMGLARAGNKYFNDTEPWKTRKSDFGACANTIHVSLQLVGALSVLLEPILPFSCERIRNMLRLGTMPSWNDVAEPLLTPGAELGEPEILFTKIDDDAIEAQLEKLREEEAKVDPVTNDSASETAYPPLGETIDFDTFLKTDLRAGTILSCEPVQKSKRLLRSQVDLGFEQRQILSGVAEHCSPEHMVGKTVVVVANLAPREIMGFESQGMLLFAEDRNGRLSPVETSGEPGAAVR